MKYLIFTFLLISASVAKNIDCDSLVNTEKLVCNFTKELANRSLNTSQVNQCKKLSLDKETYFIFDGGGVYSDKVLNLEIAKRELFQGYNQDEQEILAPIFKSYKEISFEAKKSGSYTIRFLIKNDFVKDMQQLIYLSHKDLRFAKRCISKNKLKSIKIIANSWGGDTAHKFSKHLNKKNIFIKSSFFIDPVRKGFLSTGALKNIFTKKNSSFFYKTSNTNKLYNFYQKSDDGSLGLVKVHGNSIKSADKNINLSKNCLNESAEFTFTNINHKSAILCPVVLENFKQFLKD